MLPKPTTPFLLPYLLLIILNLVSFPVFSMSNTVFKDSIKQQEAEPENFVLTSISKNNTSAIKIKWYSKAFIYQEGVNIYRKESHESNWQKLNGTPLKKGDYSPTPEELKQDKELKQYVDLVNAIQNLEGVAKLGAYVKSFKSDAFSQYLGIEFIDRTVSAGKTVQYKICAYVSGIETEIGLSKPVLTGKATELLPPQEIEILAKNKKATIKWLPETSRYYAVDIYRMFDSTGSDRKKINKDPIIVSKNKNEKGIYTYPEKFYIDEKLKPDTIYYYSFKTIDFFGEESEFCKPIKVFIKDLDAPVPPVWMDKETKHKRVTLTWRKTEFEKDFVGFNIYRATRSEKEYTLINKTPLTKADSVWTDSVTRYGLFRYVIASVDRSGNEGVTEEIAVETIDEIPPAIPKGLVIKADTGRITLTWEPNKESDLWGYMVFQAINKHTKNDQYVLITPEPLTSNVFKQELAKNSKNKFLYKVLALDSTYNKSELSDFAVTTLPDVVGPNDPFISACYVNADKRPVIEFFKNTELDLMGYHLYRTYQDNEEEKTEQVNARLIDRTAIRYIDRGFDNDGLVTYYLVAIDSSSNYSKKSNLVKLNIKKEETIDTYAFKSFSVKTLKLPNSWQIKWKLDGPEDVFYVVYIRESGDENFEPQTKNLSATTYTLNLKNSSKVYVQVRAYTTKGLIAKSDIKLIENN